MTLRSGILLALFSFLFSLTARTAGNAYGPGIVFEGEHPVYLGKYFHCVLPGGKARFKILSTNRGDMEIKTVTGILHHNPGEQWEYIAPPASGMDKITVTDRKSNRSIQVIVFILTPRSLKKGEYLNGYRIGNYPSSAYKGKATYTKPAGFIEVTEENKDIYITPHFRLRQFLCKQTSGWPKYLVLQPELVVKLETIIGILKEKGTVVKTLFIMSGYRTPYYNHLIGNVKYSRHIYGDAADIYVDDNHDRVMDDLNHDGKNDMKDADIIYSIVSKMDRNPQYAYLTGGLGKYRKTGRHTWFVHVDVRGYKARW